MKNKRAQNNLPININNMSSIPSTTTNFCTSVEYQNLCQDIEAFNMDLIEKSQNDDMNKKREAIVEMIINNSVPEELYQTSAKWSNMRTSVWSYVEKVLAHAGISASREQIKCATKAGRGHNFDFSLTVIDIQGRRHDLKLELKFNASTISDAPQFVSPMKPSQYMGGSYEEFFYENYLWQLTELAGICLPEKSIYLKQVHGNKPVCIKEIQDKYYAGCKSSSKFTGDADDLAFYHKANELSKESIAAFIGNNELNLIKLGEYLKVSQQGKYYMMFKNDEYHMETVDMDEYELVNVNAEPSKSRYIVTTKTGRELKVLLRWKNGNGIAYPAFQIS